MLVDLFGRGYSDTPCDLPHDARLYTSEILIALCSSPLSWTGASSGKFSLVGFSLGGGIAAAFTCSFPHLVASLVLLAPSGLVRPSHISKTSRLLYSKGLMPENLLEYLVKKRLEAGPSNATTVKVTKQTTTADAAVEQELPKQDSSFDTAQLSKPRPHVTVAAAVAWQVKAHEGFIKSFMSSIRHGPITEQHEDWRQIGQRLAAQNVTTNEEIESAGLQNGKVLLICGRHDPIIIKNELVEDATNVLGGNMEFRFVDAGHELPITKSEEVVEHISDFWSVPS
ncbi:MAG: hypothetical protein M1830_003498 [Pleopsidium flavum]|nr:MAG: hypothetical protein M1830_003498 [Pleopsidium flavum]